MQRVRIAIDPRLKEKFGPEICWTWRVLLTGIGLSWQEVPISGSECEIAYLSEETPFTGDYRICIHANMQYWEHRSSYRLAKIDQVDGWSYPVFKGENNNPRLFHHSNGRIVFDRDIIFYVFWIATGQEELHHPKDRHGHVIFNESAFYREQVLHSALASDIGFNLEKQFAKIGFVRTFRRWPNGKNAAACVGHDVDYPEAIKWLEPFRIIQGQGIIGIKAALTFLSGKRTHWHFASWVSLEKTLNIKSAFYFVARQGSLYEYMTGTPDPFYDVKSEKFRKIFKYLTDEGFEIGLHASYKAFESREKFATEKQILEEASGQRVYGNRHHYWHMDPRDLESTLLLHERIGLKYDSSLIHERYVGWRRGLTWPFYPFHQQQRRKIKVLQIPIVWMDNQFFGYQRDNPGNRHEILRNLCNKIIEQGGCLCIDIHDYVFDDVFFPGWADTFRQLWEYLVVSSDFWLETPARIAQHWTNRYNFIVQTSHGLMEDY